MVSVCLPSDALLQHLPSYLAFSYLGCGVYLHGFSSKVQLRLLTLDEETPLIQGKELRLCFAGAAVKRYPHVQGKRNPSKMVGVARGHQRADTLKPYHRKLVNLITLGPQPYLTQ